MDVSRSQHSFKELLDEKVITNISVFKAALERQSEDIKKSIGSLNDALRLIDYTPSTYIQLCFDQACNSEVRNLLLHAAKGTGSGPRLKRTMPSRATLAMKVGSHSCKLREENITFTSRGASK